MVDSGLPLKAGLMGEGPSHYPLQCAKIQRHWKAVLRAAAKQKSRGQVRVMESSPPGEVGPGHGELVGPRKLYYSLVDLTAWGKYKNTQNNKNMCVFLARRVVYSWFQTIRKMLRPDNKVKETEPQRG